MVQFAEFAEFIDVCQRKWKMDVCAKARNKSAMPYDVDPEWDDDTSDIMPLSGEAARAMEHLEHEKDEEEVLRALKHMGLDVEMSDNDGGEHSLGAKTGAA